MSGPGAPSEASAGRRAPTRLVVVLVAVVLVALWVILGYVRAGALARDYFDAREAGKTVADVQVEVFPESLLSWSVTVRAQVTEAGGARYDSSMILSVEPITGSVTLKAAG